MSFSSLQPGRMIQLGHYPQAADGASLPIDWRVLAVDAEQHRALVLSEHILDMQPFHYEACPVYWPSSSLRAWLQDHFMHTAFTREEEAEIVHPESAEDPAGEFLWSAFGMEDATSGIADAVFLLSQADVPQHFHGQSPFFTGLSADVTPWVMEQYDLSEARQSFWLRSSMSQAPMAFIASPCDSVGASAIEPEYREGVRPAMWIRMD